MSEQPIVIQIEATPEIVSLLKQLIKSKGVSVGNRKYLDEYLTLSEGAKEAKVTYHTFREWVVVKKLIPFSRLGDSPRGDIRVKRRDVYQLIEGKGQKKKTGSKGREATII